MEKRAMAEITAPVPTQTSISTQETMTPTTPVTATDLPAPLALWSFRTQDTTTLGRNWNLKSEDVEQCGPEGF